MNIPITRLLPDRAFLLVVSAFLISCFAGCATLPSANYLTPAQAIATAAERLDGLTGTFKMTVRAIGRKDGSMYLNSESDYRDQRCLTLELPPKASWNLEQRLGGDPAVMLKGKEILVTGTARRVTTWFYSHGVRTDKYYFQTHIRVTDVSKIEVLSASGG